MSGKIDPANIAQTGALIVLITDIYEILVEKQILTQGDAIARLTAVSNAVMGAGPEESRAHAVVLVDLVRNAIAGEPKPKPS